MLCRVFLQFVLFVRYRCSCRFLLVAIENLPSMANLNLLGQQKVHEQSQDHLVNNLNLVDVVGAAMEHHFVRLFNQKKIPQLDHDFSLLLIILLPT